MSAIATFLEHQGYNKIPFRIRKSNHLYLNARINGVKGLFLLDTGAQQPVSTLINNRFSFLIPARAMSKRRVPVLMIFTPKFPKETGSNWTSGKVTTILLYF